METKFKRRGLIEEESWGRACVYYNKALSHPANIIILLRDIMMWFVPKKLQT